VKRVVKLQSEARLLSREVDSVLTPLKKKLNNGGKLNRKENLTYVKFESVRKKLITETGAYPQPMLVDQIGYLLSMVNGVDQKPGHDAILRLEELTAELFKIKEEFHRN